MDFEKAYKEALNWMRNIYPTLAGSDKEDAEHYFPELNESEDERVRKTLIEALKTAKTVGELKFILPEPIRAECIAYLEKQKEQKKSLSEKFRPDFPAVADFIESVDELEKNRAIEILEDYLKWAVSESEEECSYTWNELANAIKLGICAMKEQKPNIELIQKSWYMEGYHDCEFGYEPRWIIKTGEGGPRYEENPKYRQIMEQKPAEWSEEDENMLWNIISIVGESKSIQADEMLDWLKSLRPQSHWKPSKEQMKALWDAYKGGKEQEPLRELIEQLKKLM